MLALGIFGTAVVTFFVGMYWVPWVPRMGPRVCILAMAMLLIPYYLAYILPARAREWWRKGFPFGPWAL